MSAAPVLYQETRLSLDSASPSSILNINTATNSFSASFGAGRKRPFDDISGLDEESYARKHLASEGSVFFRPKSKAPRSFLWRVLDERQLLEVQCVDLVLDANKHAKAESWLTFHIALPAPIIPGGVALADAEEKDALEVFVITSDKELYTVTLRRDLLVRETVPTDFDAATCVKRFGLNLVSYRRPYRLQAVGSLELLLSLSDGSILRLTRQPNENAAQWRETQYSEGGWKGTLKRGLPFTKTQTVRYDNHDLNADTVAAMAKSPNGRFIWTLGLDHILKAWDMESGKVAMTRSLVGAGADEDEHNKNNRYIMSAEQGTLLQIVSAPDAANSQALATPNTEVPYYLIAYSPKDHEFKFFGVRSGRDGEGIEDVHLDDMHRGEKLIPPIDDLMNTNIWHMEHFAFSPGENFSGAQLWLRVRSGAVCRTFMLNFDLLDQDGAAIDLEDVFASGWSAVDSSSLTVDKLKSSVDFIAATGSQDMSRTPSEKWLNFLFFPGRFSQASLESALYLYCKGRNLPTSTSRGIRTNEQPLKERITGAVAAKILLRRLPSNDRPDYESYQRDLQTQWETFYSLLTHLHNRRHEAVGFAFDLEECLPWAICADFVAPMRANSGFENLTLNADLIMSGDINETHDNVRGRIIETDEDIARSQFLALARRCRSCFAAAPQSKLRSIAIANAMAQTPDETAEEGMRSIYDRCNFQEEIGELEYNILNDLSDELNGLGGLNDDHFLAITERIEDKPANDRGVDRELLGRLGRPFSVAVAQETLQRSQAILLDMLTLLVFLHCDLQEDELSEELRPAQVYENLMMHLRHVELRLWLVSNIRIEKKQAGGRRSEQLTLYEHMFAQDWRAKPDRENVSHGLSELLTAWSKNWIFGINISHDYDRLCGHILADLVEHHDIDLASDFLQISPDTAWISYLKGRLYVLNGEYELAGLAFHEAANEMATMAPDENSLLTMEEKPFFAKGLASYYHHVSSLFDKLKVFASTAEFAQLALHELPPDNELHRSLRTIDKRKKSDLDSPAPQRIDDAMEELHLIRNKEHKDELRLRLFNSLNSIGRSHHAYKILLEIDNYQLQKSSLRTILDTCIKRDAVSTLLELPIAGDLAKQADTILLELAKKSMTSGLPSGPAYHKILFAFRTQNNNYRGAAAILYDHLERLRKSSKLAIQDPDDETLVQIYVLLVNTLACCGEGEAWLLADPIPHVHEPERQRKLVTISDIRREYTAELDRRSEIMHGRFPLMGGGDDMDLL
ncbi:Nucleoporin [Fulvia fulva]|uniref:Nucleoporin n=1 Tax=Passalora fulva TaxID=5499 RepID=A0A9Q8L696_PASFU|nr:Nucleoporin [Fulvia fulva]KAK4635657.1 Nucleoporin [Fulvia fulva]KAK4637188.1 Nucleoporin [Fulvia fulva]UJO11646.1 Nucleoporin [Fulvia fulva]WPV08154.1 Nucleoporin [Fulvia fulva]WPV23756.1 Nucleoporin [Fulvia fulva]